jgi:pimeloyl-ACP methyl ester carboxylesterase
MKKTDVLMIHGAFCGGWVFDAWRALFEARGYRVHAPTLRFHDCGRKPPQELGTVSMRDYARDLETAAADFSGPPVVIGHSMGGLLAQMLAARMPVKAAVLLAPSAPWGVLPSTPFEIVSAQALYFAGEFWHMPLKPKQWIAAANALDRLSQDEREAVFKHFVPESGRATFEIMHWPLDLNRATQIDPREVTCPILCVAGSRDRVNPPATVRRVAQRYKGRVVYEELRDHSHWLIGEPGWEKIAGRTLDWLEEVLTGEPATEAKSR